MPFWGLSALAAGSIGASVSDRVQAGLQTQFIPAPKNDAIVVGLRDRSAPARPLSPTIERPPRFAKSGVKALPQAVAEAGKNRPLMMLLDTHIELVKPTTSILPTAKSMPNAVSQPGKALDPPSPAAVLDSQAFGFADVAQIGARISPTESMTTAPAESLENFSEFAGAGMQPANGRAIYGTSAQNAYKVYFPQAEPAAPAKLTESAKISSKATGEDRRILTRQGSYLFYDDAPTGAADPITANVKSNGGGKAVLAVIAAANKANEANELTSPVLQKQPLNFGDRALEPSPPSSSRSSKTLIGEANGGDNGGQ